MRFLVLFFFHFPGFIFCQKFQPGYFAYHLRMVQIEELVVEEDFEKASVYLDSLFRSFEVKFSKDWVIAAQIALLANRKDQAIPYLEASLQKGVKVACLKEIPLLFRNLNPSEWDTLEGKYQDSRELYLRSINPKLMLEFHRRYQLEQDGKTTGWYKEVVYSNFNRIKELIAVDSFPGEQLIGIDEMQYAPSISDCEIGNSRLVVTLLHYDFPISELGLDVFWSAIKKGELHPREFATIYNFEANRHSVLYEKSEKDVAPLPEYHFNFPFGKKISDLEKVNTDRATFGICTFQTDLKKKALEEKYGMKLFFNYK